MEIDDAQLARQQHARHRDAQRSEQHELGVGQADRDAELRGDHPGLRSPAELGDRADDEAAGLERKQLVQRAEDRRGVGDGILRKENRVGQVRDDGMLQRVRVDAPFEREQAAHAVEREAKAQLDRRRELDADDQHQRERIGADEADRRDRDRAETQIQHAAVLVVLVIEEAAAANDAGVHRDTGRVRHARLDGDRQGAAGDASPMRAPPPSTMTSITPPSFPAIVVVELELRARPPRRADRKRHVVHLDAREREIEREHDPRTEPGAERQAAYAVELDRRPLRAGRGAEAGIICSRNASLRSPVRMAADTRIPTAGWARSR